MNQYYLAIDIGASSGRHILGHLDSENKLRLEEIYRFSNGMKNKNGQRIWETDRLFDEIRTGMKKCKEQNKIPVSMGIDTWGIDFVLLDRAGQRIGEAVGYRDDRTIGMDKKVFELIPERELYRRTGIQKAAYNTIYQLMALKIKNEQLLKQAACFLMIPDYFHYLLTGRKAVEYTNATTTQLVDPESRKWNMELIRALGYPTKIFPEILKPGTVLGELSPKIQEEVGFSCQVILPGTHDTASAVAAVPADPDKSVVYISSGTWSLLGTERLHADCSEPARTNNFTNEGGYDGRYCFLKNIMGMWLIQSVRAELAPEESFARICELASGETITSLIDCENERFLAPQCMFREIQAACAESGQQVPEGIAQIACVIYHSLAACYTRAVRNLEKITGENYETIHIVGGGSNAEFLNRLTSETSARTVSAGPSEATAIGNLIVQMIAKKEFPDLKTARKCITRTLEEETHGK